MRRNRSGSTRLTTLLRLAADFDNYRKRVAREQVELTSRANERLLNELLPVLDDLERALEAAAEHEEAKLEEGVRLVHRSLLGPSSATGSRRSRPTAPSTRTSTRRCSRSPARGSRRDPCCRCCRRATGSGTGCSGPRG